MLTIEETKKYLEDYHINNDQKVLSLLIESNIGLVNFIANKYIGSCLSFDELKSAGLEGLFKSIINFDLSKYNISSFSSYAASFIEGYIRMDLRVFRRDMRTLSLDYLYDEDDDEYKLLDIIQLDDELLEKTITNIDNESLKDALADLKPKERDLIVLLYGLDRGYPRTKKEVARILKCDRNTVTKRENRILEKLEKNKNVKRLKIS